MTFPVQLLMLLAALTGLAGAQTGKLKPLHELLPPGNALQGTWWSDSAQGREYFTFQENGRVIMVSAHGRKEVYTYTTDTSATPWKLDFVTGEDKGRIPIYSAFDFPEKDRLRLAKPSIEKAKRPTAEELQKSDQILQRLPWEPNAGLFQAVEAHLKSLDGNWQGITNGSRGTLTLSRDGRFTTAEGTSKQSGRFRIDVRAVPCKIDLLPDDGTGPVYGLYEIKDGKLRFSRAKKKVEERVTDFEGAVEFEKKK